MTRRHRTARLATALALLLTALAIPTAASAAPSDTGCLNHNLNTIDKLLECVDADDAFDHLAALQAIADANGGTRASGTPGYDASADYVADALEAAGYIVERQVFQFSLYTENSSSLSADGAPVATPDDELLRFRCGHRRHRDCGEPRPRARQQLGIGL